MQAWSQMLILLTLQHVVENEIADKFTLMIVQSLMQQRGLIQEKTFKRFVCFGVDGAFVFQGCCIKVITQLKEKYFPYMMGQHYMAHKTNLVVQVFSNLLMVVKLEELLQSLYFYFSSSSKQHLEFTKLLEIMET
jgi:hypothetical protein